MTSPPPVWRTEVALLLVSAGSGYSSLARGLSRDHGRAHIHSDRVGFTPSASIVCLVLGRRSVHQVPQHDMGNRYPTVPGSVHTHQRKTGSAAPGLAFGPT